MSQSKQDPKVLVDRVSKRLKLLCEKEFYGTVAIQMVAGVVVLVHEDRTWKPENGDLSEAPQAPPDHQGQGQGKPRT